MSDFATNCPEGSCPPELATDVEGEVYRFVRGDPPIPEDMRTYADENKAAEDLCQRCALSVLVRPEDIPIARKAMPWFKRRRVAVATLRAEHGKICRTGAHRWHHSLWVRAAHAPTIHESFQVVPS